MPAQVGSQASTTLRARAHVETFVEDAAPCLWDVEVAGEARFNTATS